MRIGLTARGLSSVAKTLVSLMVLSLRFPDLLVLRVFDVVVGVAVFIGGSQQ